MKKLLLIATIALFSCKKESLNSAGKTCWVCTYAPLNNNTRPPQTICGTDDPKPVAVDANGNDLSYRCERR